MLKVVVADTSCLIALSNIGELEILKKLYREVITTPEVANEFGEVLPEWIHIKIVADKQKQQILEFQIDKGEASAITLSLEIFAELIILDDYKARLAASSLGLTLTGTLGVLIKAKGKGIISSIKPILNKLKNTNFRISEALVYQVLRESGE